MSVIRTHPAVRLWPPASVRTGDRWVAENLLHSRRFALSPAGTMLLAACFHPKDREAAVREVARRLRQGVKSVQQAADALESHGLLVSGDSMGDEVNWVTALRREWAARGWEEAAEYHLLTYNYPFVDYSADGRSIDQVRMNEYAGTEPDNNRVKTYPHAPIKYPMPRPGANLIPTEFDQAWLDRVSPSRLTKDVLLNVLAMTFGKVGQLQPPWSGAAPTLLRTTPSGGARHPTEAYVVVVDVPGLLPGWYHVAVEPPGLELLAEGADRAELERLFFGAYCRAPFAVQALVVLTCMFERNMYRYREPRTFRAVHLDAGHLTATLESILTALGIRAFAHAGVDDVGVEQRLGVSGLEEGVMLAVALGGGDAEEAESIAT